MNAVSRLLPDTVHVLERDWLSSNNIVLFDDDHATLIDTGYIKHEATTCQLVATTLQRVPGGKPARLERIINTHLHSDHCGANAALFNEHACQIAVPQVCVASVNEWTPQADAHASLGQGCNRFPAHEGITPGQVIHAGALDWTALAAPGHDPSSLIFFSEQHRILISADNLWEYGFGVIFPEIFGDSGFAEQADVLTLIGQLDPAVVIPGHGQVFTNVPAALDRARQRINSFVQAPERSHRHALKVMIKFILLDKESMTLNDLHATTTSARIFQALTQLLQLGSPTATVDWAVEQLLAQHQLAREGDTLFNANGLRATA